MYEITSNYDIELVIGHNDRMTSYDKKLKLWSNSLDKVKCKLISVKYEDDVNNSLLRNAALKSVSGNISILMDVDIYPDINIIEYLQAKIDGGSGMVMLPCIYLTDLGTRKLLKKNNFNEIINDFFNFKRKYVMHVAVPSSVIAFETILMKEVGEFDERYSGHGYEDFDFIVRLALECKKICLHRELIIDKPYTAPLLAEGFRKRLAKICIPELVDKKFAFHLFHSRGNRDKYKISRELNRTIYLEKFEYLINDRIWLNGGDEYDLISDFFRACIENAVKVSDYYAYFDARPSHVINKGSFHGLRRKIFKYFKSFLG